MELHLLLLTVSQLQTHDDQLHPLFFPIAQENQSGRENTGTIGLKKVVNLNTDMEQATRDLSDCIEVPSWRASENLF